MKQNNTGDGSVCSALLVEEILIFMRILVLILVIITILCGCNKTTIDSDINTSRPTEAIEFKIKENLVDNAYDEIISIYETIVGVWRSDWGEEGYPNFTIAYESNSLPRPNGAEFFEWSSMVIEAKYPKNLDYGIIFDDINGDGIQELFWVRKDYTILAIFTICDDKPILLEVFWPKHKCSILDNGDLLITDSVGHDGIVYTIMELNKNSNKLTVLRTFGYERNCGAGGEAKNETYYLKEKEKIAEITEKIFNQTLASYGNLENSNFQKKTIYVF
ncbi:MAG: hypothetical protein IJN15_02225 [Clostridia bacterium]|nr:hypothetical protein [Clostridia bacterium]